MLLDPQNHWKLKELCTYRAGEAPSTGLTESLIALGFETDRLKTGTPARVDARSIDFSVLEAQPGDEDVRWFSFDPEVRDPSSLVPYRCHEYSCKHDVRVLMALNAFFNGSLQACNLKRSCCWE